MGSRKRRPTVSAHGGAGATAGWRRYRAQVGASVMTIVGPPERSARIRVNWRDGATLPAWPKEMGLSVHRGGPHSRKRHGLAGLNALF